MRGFQLGPIVVLLCGWATGSDSLAGDYFLTIGGGYDPQGNQVSLERNVEFFRQVLTEQRPDRPQHTIFFADGSDSHRDLQFRDPAFKCTPGRRIAIELFGDSGDIDIAYRNHTVAGVSEATSPQRIRSYLQQLGPRLGSSDRLIVYATAHGGSGGEKTPYNTSLYTWNHRKFSAEEFATWLGGLPQDTPVVMVMVQCYAGGFARTLFNEANPKKGVARQLRAGFFAQVHNRPAAGCTPDVNEDSYQEYSSFFWAALAGHDRVGGTIERVDVDGDGVTSFAEAHAYAVCESETVDIPVRTSDAYLDYFSTDGSTSTTQYDRERFGNKAPAKPTEDLLEVSGTLRQALVGADPVDRFIAQSLIRKLSIDVSGSVQQVDEANLRMRRQLQRVKRTAGRAVSEHRRARDRVRSEVRREWPELDADLSPMLAALMSERAAEFEQKVTSMRSYQSMTRLADAKEKANTAVLDAKKDEALVLRLEHVLERIVREANLPKVASTQIVNRYNELLALESGNLVSGR